MSGQVQQRQTATADSKGNCTITLPSVPAVLDYTGTVSVINSPLSVTWTINNNGSFLGSVLGTNGFGPQTFLAGSQIQFVGTQLVPGTQYTAVLNAFETDAGTLTPESAGPVQQIVSASSARTVIQHLTPISSTASDVANLLPTDRSLVIIVNAPSGISTYEIDVVGNSTGLDWTNAQNITPLVTFSGPLILTLPCYGAIEPTGVTVSIDSLASPVTAYYVIAVPDEIMEGSYSSATYIKTVPNQGGSDSHVNMNAAPTTDVTLLSAPSSGFAYWIKAIAIGVQTTTNAASGTSVRGLSTQTPITVGATNTQGISENESFTELVVAEGLQLHNTSPVTAGVGLWYTTVPII